MNEADFAAAFCVLNGDPPFPWQWALYQKFLKGEFPESCSLPTGLGKTSIIHIWLLALACAPDKVPRRLVYVVNRRTVVDQSTRVAEKIREQLPQVPEVEKALWRLCSVQPTEEEWRGKPRPRPVAISTLRGQFADNREWSADPARPAIIAGTVDMIGSRLLFSGYGCGFKSRPLHAGFLGQDSLLVHDEAHLEKPFQDLVEAIEREQRGGRADEQRGRIVTGSRQPDFRRMKVMALTATPRGGERPFELTDQEKTPPEVVPEGPDPLYVAWRRLRAKKKLSLVPVAEESKVVPKIADLAWKRGQENLSSRVIIFVRSVNAVSDVEKGLRAKKVSPDNIWRLTGTMRGFERNRQADPRREDAHPVFARFLPPPKRDEEPWKVKPREGTVYLICTAAGEVGVDISADHLVCDLTPFDSMTQRFGRVNRYGDGDARIDVVHEEKPSEKKQSDLFDQRRWLSLQRLQRLIDLGGDASPHAIEQLPLPERIAAFTPTPTILPVSDILFDAWALTTISGKVPGRPPVEPYLHGISEWEPPETHVGWRLEVGIITGDLRDQYPPKDLLEDYPLKPHELLQDNSSRVFDRLRRLKAPADTPIWIVSDDDTVEVMTLGELIDAGRERIERETVLLPPAAGGLAGGMLTEESETADDVADEWFDDKGRRRRVRVRDDDEGYDVEVEAMRLIRRIDLPAVEEGGGGEGRYWRWLELPAEGDTDGSKTNKKPVLWRVHTTDVMKRTAALVKRLSLSKDLQKAIRLAAKWHDLGKRRTAFQAMLGNFKYPGRVLAKSGKKGGRMPELYRHEFGSLIDVLDKKTQAFYAKLCKLTSTAEEADLRDVVLHLIAVHHGYGRPHFPADRAFDPEPKGQKEEEIATEVVQRFARLQRLYGRWGLAYLESLLRAADYAASSKPSRFVEEEE